MPRTRFDRMTKRQEAKFNRLVTNLVNAAFECGNWDSQKYKDPYREIYAAKLRAELALADFVGGMIADLMEKRK